MSTVRTMLAVLLMLLPLAELTSRDDAQQLIERRELVIAMDRDQINLNPHEVWSIEMTQIMTGLAEGLFSYHPVTMEPVPALARSVESEDLYTWTIQLREDARFSSGDPITAHHFVESWLHLIDPQHRYEYASMLDIIEGVRSYRSGGTDDPADLGFSAPDDYTLELSLISPAPYLLNILCHHSFSPIHPDQLGKNLSSRPEEFISSGAFMIDSQDEGDLLLRKNPHYWDRGYVDIEYIRITSYDSPWLLISDFQGALVHWSLSYINPSLLTDSDLVIGYPEYSTGFYYFSAVEGAYADPRVRRSLALLAPWEEFRTDDTFFVPARSLIPQTEEYHGVQGIVRSNRDEALDLLDRAGYPVGAGLPPLTIAIYPEEVIQEVTRRIAGAWEDALGISVSIDVLPYSEYAQQDSSYDLSFLSWVGDFYDPYSFLALFHSQSSLNLGRQYNPIYDGMIDLALMTDSNERRYELLKEAETYLLHEATALPLFHGVSINLIHTGLIGGWSPNLLDIHPLKHLYFTGRSPDRNNRRL